jgi:hypothetical protein
LTVMLVSTIGEDVWLVSVELCVALEVPAVKEEKVSEEVL